MYIELINKIMYEIGLYCDNECNIRDQDFENVLSFEGKTLKYPYNNVITLNPMNDIEFDPISNSKLMIKLFNYYLDKISKLDNNYISIFYTVPNQCVKNKLALHVKGTNKLYKTNYYYKDSLKYIEALFLIGGYNNFHLSNFDEPIIINR